MYTISRLYTFDAAHRIIGHDRCGVLHGHTYHVYVSVSTKSLSSAGMVLDYADLDRLVKPIIVELDHHYLAGQSEVDDPNIVNWRPQSDIVYLPIENSTAEHLSKYLFDEIQSRVEAIPGIFLLEVDVQETPRSSAIWTQE